MLKPYMYVTEGSTSVVSRFAGVLMWGVGVETHPYAMVSMGDNQSTLPSRDIECTMAMCLICLVWGATITHFIASPFVCTVVDCGLLTPILNSTVLYLTNGRTTFGAVAQYLCNPGHSLDGNSLRVCLENGSWNGTEPICRRTSGLEPELGIIIH